MDLIAIIKAILPVDPAQLKPESRSLNPGDRLLGRVLKLHTDGKVTMDFKTFRALTEVPRPVQVGQTLPLEVIDTGNPFKMKIISETLSALPQPSPDGPAKSSFGSLPPLLPQLGDDLKIIINALSGSKDNALPPAIRTALKSLNTFLERLDPTANPKKIAADIQTKVENSGLFFEKKMEAALKDSAGPQSSKDSPVQPQTIQRWIEGDIKPNLMRLLNYLADEETLDLDTVVKERTTKALQEVLKDLGEQKHLAIKRHDTQEPVQVFHLALPFQEKEQTAKLKLFCTPKKKDSSQTPPRVALLLEMEHLGPVRADLMMLTRDLTITFYVKDVAVQRYFEAQTESIRPALAGLFDSVAVTVRVSEKKIKEFDAAPALQPSDHKIDVHI